MESHESVTTLLLGGGYSLTELAHLLPSDSFAITTTSSEKVSSFQKFGFQHAEQVSVLEPKSLKALFTRYPNISTVIDSIPPLREGDPTQGAKNVVEALPSSVPRLFYLSTTGVYGKKSGEWVTEETERTPFYKSSEARVEVEDIYLAVPNLQTTCFRLSGIYGPGRGVGLSMKSGKYRLIENDPRITNRIHVADIAKILSVALEHKAQLPKTFNINDDLPAPADEVVSFYREKFGFPKPTLISQEEANKLGGRMVLNQKVSNALVKETLDYEFIYPSYREGGGTEFSTK